MAKELIINASLPEIRIALMEDGQIQELLIERDSDKGIVGNIYKGRVTRVLPGMQAAFVDIGLEKAAFLYVDDIYVHPKVMGEETEVSAEEESETDANAPIQAFNAEATDEIIPEGAPAEEEEERDTIAEALKAGATDQSEITDEEEEDDEDSEEVDSSMLDSHASEHFERDENGFEGEEDTNPMIAAPNADDFDDSEEDEEDDEEGDDEGEDEDESPEMQAGATEGATVEGQSAEGQPAEGQASADGAAPLAGLAQDQRPGRRGRNRRRGRRGRNGGNRDGQNQNRESGAQRNQFAAGETFVDPHLMPESVNASLDDQGSVISDRAQMEGEVTKQPATTRGPKPKGQRPEFREQRGRDRRIKSKHSRPRAPASISDMLKEGQEVIVQIAKDPIATKGARLTCHVSLPGRHLVCMPTIDHVGVSRRIERDDERRRLRDFVEKNRPRKMGFIVRTASGGKDPESWIKTDIDYLSKLWREIRTKTEEVSAPALVYEDLNSILRAIRDWVNEDIDRIVVDSRYYYNELMAFSERFMPQLAEIIELYQGDIPVFDAYGISGELHRSLERRVWLKSGGYIVIDQAEALVAIDVNTGRFVGKKSLEDTILKTNLEAAEEIAYQLRLRNCGGIIICDFIDMERDENRMRVYRALDEALKRDRARPTIQKISDLGLVEMTRKRTRDTVIRTLCEPCTHCEGKGYTKSTRTVGYDILREIERLSVDRDAKKILVSAHESVIDILAIDLREVLDQLERRYNKSVYLQSVMDFHNEQFEVATDRQPSKKSTGDIARQLRVERERNDRKEKSRKHQREDRSRDAERDSEGGDDRTRETGRDTGSDREARGGGQGGGRDRNRGGRDRNRGGRDRNRDENRNDNRNDNRNHGGGNDRNQDRNQDRNAQGGGEGGNQNRGSFRPNGRPPMVVAVDADAPLTEGQIAAPAPGSEEFQGGEAASFTPAPALELTGNEDEDQLAYLRAQAAQDAALANGAAPGANQPNQRGGGRNQNNRGGGQGGGRDQNRNGGGRGRNDRGGRGGRGDNRGDNRNAQAGGQGGGNAGGGQAPGAAGQGGNNRFRPARGAPTTPGTGGGLIQPRNPAAQAAAPQPQNAYLEPQNEPVVPDYEVLSSPTSDDGSES